MITFNTIAGFPPFPFQKVRHDYSKQPICILQCPTGSGKTEAYFINWVLDLLEKPKETPIRLVIQLPLRTLVEQTTDRIEEMITNSGLDIKLYTLMGGRVEDDFIHDPTTPSVVVGTLDQIVSRQLMRPYCASPNAAPLHFNATNNNVRVVVDETQLQDRAYPTALRLQHLYQKFGGFHPRQLLLCSATLNSDPLKSLGITDVGNIQVSEEDKQHPIYSQKFGREKALHLHDSLDVDEVVELIQSNHQPNSLTLVVVNTVKRAQEIFGAIQGSKRILHSRFRKHDRDTLQDGLRDFKGVLVSTQVVEAGVDLDARVLVTDLAPWSSVVQRAGRAGRNGTYAECDIHVINTSQHLPYESVDMKRCWEQLNKLPNFNISTVLETTVQETIPQNYISEDDFLSLYNTRIDGEDIPTADYIRKVDDGNVFVVWRENPSPVMPFVQRQEICGVSITEVKNHIPQVWKYDEEKEEWVVVSIQSSKDLTPGCQYIIDSRFGSYTKEMGWQGGLGAYVPEIPLIEKEKVGGFKPSEPLDLTLHLEETRDFIIDIMGKTHIEDQELIDVVSRSGFLHDIGKASDHFQWFMQSGNPQEGVLLAKNESHKVMRRHRVDGLRHEAHSALACVEMGEPWEVVYLVMAHHGKVRSRFDGFDWIEEEEGRIHGVKEGDILPVIPKVTDAPITVHHPKTQGFEWDQLFKSMLNGYGPYKLAEMESLVRNGDVMSSRLHQI